MRSVQQSSTHGRTTDAQELDSRHRCWPAHGQEGPDDLASGPAGRKVIRTFLPVCRPTPVARIEFLSVRCPTMRTALLHRPHRAAGEGRAARTTLPWAPE